MGDRRPAKEPEPRTTSCHLFKWSMRNEARRLRTFRQWPATSPISPRDLAKAGFFYVGPRDEVRCFCCSGILKDWAPGDCPVAEHRKFFPSCKFIRGEPVGNQEIPPPPQEAADTVDGQVVSVLQGVNSEEAAVAHPPANPAMVAQEEAAVAHPPANPAMVAQEEAAAVAHPPANPAMVTQEEAAVPCAPANPAMVTEEARLWTFQGCPRYPDVHYQALARAGFFYTGQGGILRCFHCNGRVRNCQIETDPWREHAKLFPGCEFLLQSRGREFVSSVQESLSNTQAPTDSRGQTGQNPSASRESLRSLMHQALHCLDEFVIVYNVIEMGFDILSVCRAVQNKHMTTGTSYISESELIADVLQAGSQGSSSTAESRGAAQGDTEASCSREETQSAQQRESDESRLSTEEQLRRLREERMCKVCLDKDVSIVFVPCGHLVACRACAFSLRLCPICRAAILDRVRTFMS